MVNPWVVRPRRRVWTWGVALAVAGAALVPLAVPLTASATLGAAPRCRVAVQAAPPAPAPTPVTSRGALGATQEVTVTPPRCGGVFLRDALDDRATSLTTSAGSFTVEPSSGVLTYTPVSGFVGQADPVIFVVVDQADRQGVSTYTVTVLPAAPSPDSVQATGPPAATLAVQIPVPAGGSLVLLDEADQQVLSFVVDGVGTYAVGSDGTSPVLTPTATFVGRTEAHFQVIDQYDQLGNAFFQVLVAPAPPAAGARSSTGAAGTSQAVTIAIPPGWSITLLDANRDGVSVVALAGQGTYALDTSTGTITFTPVAGFTGNAAAVVYVLTDDFEQRAEGTYTATVLGAGVADPGPTPAESAAPGSSARQLSATGVDPAALSALALAALAAGAGCVLIRRRYAVRPATRPRTQAES